MFSIGQTSQKFPFLWRHLHHHVIHVFWTHLTQHPKLHLDWFSRFHTAYGRESLYFTMCIKTQLMRDYKIKALQLTRLKKLTLQP